jgi:hypothetical protein
MLIMASGKRRRRFINREQNENKPLPIVPPEALRHYAGMGNDEDLAAENRAYRRRFPFMIAGGFILLLGSSLDKWPYSLAAVIVGILIIIAGEVVARISRTHRNGWLGIPLSNLFVQSLSLEFEMGFSPCCQAKHVSCVRC